MGGGDSMNIGTDCVASCPSFSCVLSSKHTKIILPSKRGRVFLFFDALTVQFLGLSFSALRTFLSPLFLLVFVFQQPPEPFTTLLGKFSTGCRTAVGWPAAAGPKEEGKAGTTTGEVLEGLREPPMILSMEKGDRCTGELDFCTGAEAACAPAAARLEPSCG